MTWEPEIGERVLVFREYGFREPEGTDPIRYIPASIVDDLEALVKKSCYVGEDAVPRVRANYAGMHEALYAALCTLEKLGRLVRISGTDAATARFRWAEKGKP